MLSYFSSEAFLISAYQIKSMKSANYLPWRLLKDERERETDRN